MTTAKLLKARDAAFAEYLAVRKAGGTSKRKRKALIDATIAWYRAGRPAEPVEYTVWQSPKLDTSILGK